MKWYNGSGKCFDDRSDLGLGIRRSHCKWSAARSTGSVRCSLAEVQPYSNLAAIKLDYNGSFISFRNDANELSGREDMEDLVVDTALILMTTSSTLLQCTMPISTLLMC